MATLQMIRRRIKSAKGISQITKAMEMVAVTKLRKAQEATLRSRTYAVGAREALVRLRRHSTAAAHPLFARRAPAASQLAILFTSDRGLAGAYNANLLRALLSLTAEAAASHAPVQLIVIGQKGAQFAARLKDRIDMIGVYTGWPVLPDFARIRPIAREATARFIAGVADHVSLVYTDFVSTVRQNVVVQDLLPIDPATLLPREAVLEDARDVLFEPSVSAVLEYIVPRLVEVQVYQAALEAGASEQAMRMLAMKNASDNARDLIDDLTLTYNGVRQAAITRELAEISAGADALS